MDAKEADIKPLRRPPVLSHQYRPFHSKSKDKLLNEKPPCICHPRNKFSRVPIVSRTPINTTAFEIEGKREESGDNKPGTSNLSSSKEVAFEKMKQSHIPRRKSSVSTDREKSGTPKNTPNFLGDLRNVQKVHLLINQEIRPDDKAASIACSRPIPTLGHIYARNNIVHSDRLNDWFVELDTPANSMDSNRFSCEVSNGNNSNDYGLKNINSNQPNNVVVYENTTARRLCRPDENMTEWLKTDIEYPTKDIESGYRSMSPKTHKPKNVKSNETKPASVIENIKIEPEIKEQVKDVLKINSHRSVLKNNSVEKSFINVVNECKPAASQIKEQPTMILTKSDISATTDYTGTAIIEKNTQYNENQTDFCKNCQYPSHVAHGPVETQTGSQTPVPSYVDCPSEVLQKTTNFEVDGCETPPTISSIAGLDLEICDNLSSHFTTEQDEHMRDWCSQCKSCDTSDKVESETTSVADSLLCTLLDDDANDGNLVKHLDRHTCWRGFQGDATGLCKKCKRYRKFPSSRYRLPKTLSSIRRRLSMHHCRRRLSRVWKNTTAKWSVWSKSRNGMRKARMMNYLLRTHIWEDADVQTNVFVCTETGTDSVMNEQKSAGISAIFYGSTCSACRRNESGPSSDTTSRCRHRQINMGPSMFPFYGYSRISRRSMSKKKMRENLCFNCTRKQNCDAETIDVQTNYSNPSKDTNDKGIDYHSLTESISVVEISEISVHEKSTYTEDKLCAPQMKDKVTSTFIHLDSIKVVNIQPKHEHTQMCVVCNNAETDVRFPNLENHSNGSTLNSENQNTNLDLVQSSGTYTVNPTVTQRSANLMTSLETKKTYNHISTQISPPNTISTSVVTSKCWKFVESNDVPKNDIANQVSRKVSCSKFQGNESTALTSESAKPGNITNKECSHAGTFTSDNKVERGNLNQPLQVCRCSQNEVVSRGTEPNNRTTSSMQTKLDAYFNTGMLVNTLVEDAMYRNVPNTTVSIDANSIGNKIMVNNAAFTNKQLKDSSIETEKETSHPKQSITVCNCGCLKGDLNHPQPCKLHPSSLIIKRSANVSTFEPEKDTKSSAEMANLILTQSNSKRFNNVNTYYVEKKKNSVTQPIPEQLETIKHSQRLSNDSSLSAEKEISTIVPSKEIDAYSKRSTNTNSVLNVRKETRSIDQNKDIVKKSINISAINIERVTKSTEQSTANINVYSKKSIDVNTHVQQETKSIVQSKPVLRGFDDKLTNNSTQYRNIDISTDSLSSRFDSMGRSRLLSVRTLGVHANEIYVQTDPVRFDDGPTYRPDTYRNQSVYTSQYILNSATPRDIDTSDRDVMHSRNKDVNISNNVHRSFKGQSSSNLESDLQLTTSAVVSSDLDADKWIKSCIERGYQSHIQIERTGTSNWQEQEADPVEKHVEENTEIKSDKNITPPTKQAKNEELLLTHSAEQIQSEVKNMDTNDLVPTTNFSQQQIVAMVDDMTSDEKEVKETILQASPETSTTATNCNKPLIEQKSECVFTSRCILPPTSRCACQKCPGCSLSPDCLFVYGMPKCIVHKQSENDAAVQISATKSQKHQNQKFSCQVPSEGLLQELYLRSVGLLASCNDVKLSRYHKHTSYKELLPPKVYEAIYETSKLMAQESKLSPLSVRQAIIDLLLNNEEPSTKSTSSGEQFNNIRTNEQQSNVKKSDKGVEVLLLTQPEMKNAAVEMSRTDQQVSVQCNDLLHLPVSGEPQSVYIHNVRCKPHSLEAETLYRSQTSEECKKLSGNYEDAYKLLDMPTHDCEDDYKTHLVSSCRYYSKLLTKQLDKVRENLTRHLATNPNYTYQIPNVYPHQRRLNEVCTMKPSAREEFGCQTFKYPASRAVKSTEVLSQAASLTDICRYDKENLKSIYFMLSAIEGRFRRIKNNID